MAEFFWPYGRGPSKTVYGTTQGDEAEIARLCERVRKCEIVSPGEFDEDQRQIAARKVLKLEEWE